MAQENSQVLLVFAMENESKFFAFPKDSVLASLAKDANNYIVNFSEDIENTEAMSMVSQLSDYPGELPDEYTTIYDFAPFEVSTGAIVDLEICAIYQCAFAV